MNTNLLNALKQITTQYGADVLGDSKRVNALLNDLAPKESKAEKKAFITCLMNGFHTELKNAPESDRLLCKNRLAQRLHDDEGFDLTLCNNSLGLLEAVLFGVQPEAAPVPAPSPHAVPIQQPAMPQSVVASQPSATQTPLPITPPMPSPTLFITNSPPQEMPDTDRKHLRKQGIIGLISMIPLIFCLKYFEDMIGDILDWFGLGNYFWILKLIVIIFLVLVTIAYIKFIIDSFKRKPEDKL
jgi:hypothetical protein